MKLYKLYLLLLSIFTFFVIAFFITPKPAEALPANYYSGSTACGTYATCWTASAGYYGCYNGDCVAELSRACTTTVDCTYGSVSEDGTQTRTSATAAWGACSASPTCPSCTTATHPADFSYTANTCSTNNGVKTCYTSDTNCTTTSCTPDFYSTANKCNSCHTADRAAGANCSCVKLTPPTNPTVPAPTGLNLSTPVMSGTLVTPSATCSNCTGIKYSPGATTLCNNADANRTEDFTAYSYKDWACTYDPVYQQSASTGTNTVTIKPWFPAITGNPTIIQNNLYDDEPMDIRATPFRSSNGTDTTNIQFVFPGSGSRDVPALGWNNDRTEGTTHNVVFTPERADGCPTKYGTAKTVTHTTLRRPDPAIRNIKINKKLTREGEPITITGEIQNSHLWDFNILLDRQGNGSDMQSFHLGHSAGRYGSASGYFSTSTASEGSWNSFSVTFVPSSETTSIAANIKIDYHRIIKPTSYRASQFNTGVLYEVAFIPTVSQVTTAMEGGVLVATITGDKFRILSEKDNANYKGDVFFNTTTQADTTGFKGNITSWTMNQIKVKWPPMTGDVKVCLKTPIADGCSISNNQYHFPTDKDATTVNNSWWTYKVLPPPECTIEIIQPPLINLYVLSKKDTSDPFLVKATWKNFDLRSPINITPILNPTSTNVEITGPLSFVTTGIEKGDNTIQLIAVTKEAERGWYDLTITGRSPIAGGWDCTAGKLKVRVDVDPFLKTTGGDVHSNKEISVPGGP